MNRTNFVTGLGIALSILLAAAGPAVAASYPSLTIPGTYPSLRMMQGSTALPGSSQITVKSKGTLPDSWTLTGDTGTDALTLSTAAGTIPARSTAAVPFTFGWADTSTLGAQSGQIILTNAGNGKTANMQVSGAVLADRILTATGVGAVRGMEGGTISGGTLSSGSDPVLDSDSDATRINTVANGSATDGTVTVKYGPTVGVGSFGGPGGSGGLGNPIGHFSNSSALFSSPFPGGSSSVLKQFNAPNQSNPLTLTLPNTSGPISGSVDLANGLLTNGEAVSVGATVLPVSLSYNVDVLQNRVLTVMDPTNSSWTLPNRVLLNTAISGLAITSGNMPLPGGGNADDDFHMTQVNTSATGVATNGLVTVQYAGTPLGQFNGPSQQAGITVSFNSTGAHAGGSLNLAPKLLSNGEAPSVGATVQPVNLQYGPTTVVARRVLTVGTGPVTLGNVLKGSYVSGSVAVTSKGDYNHATSVTVAPNTINESVGGGLLRLSATATTITGQGKDNNRSFTTNVPTTVQFAQYNTGTTTVTGTLPVVTAEAPSVNDTTPYPSVNVVYSVGDVGVATIGSPSRFGRLTTGFGPVMTGFVPHGLTLGSFAVASTSNVSLSSEVNPVGTLAGGGTNLYGAVGSEFEFVDSTAVAATQGATVSMSWRQRTNQENNLSPSPSGPLPSGIGWLSSDVVKVCVSQQPSGTPPAYAVQESFDNGINTAFDGTTGGTVANEFADDSLYLMELNGNGQWVNAVGQDMLTGTSAKPHVSESLTGFLDQYNPTNSDAVLRSLVGSWGVGPTPNANGSYEAWAILDQVGTMAVSPEPATLALLISAGAGLVVYGWSRRRKGRRVCGS
jgi:hypothetical protein